MAPEEWDAFSEGVSIPRGSDVETERPGPAVAGQKGHTPHLTGRWEEALPEARALFADPVQRWRPNWIPSHGSWGGPGCRTQWSWGAVGEWASGKAGEHFSGFPGGGLPEAALVELLANIPPEYRSSLLRPFLGQQAERGKGAL